MAAPGFFRQTSPSSIDLAADVMTWAASEGAPRPRGRARGGELGLRALSAPPPDLVARASALAARRAAKLGFRAPPLGQTAPFGVGPFVLAAAIGLANDRELADGLATACPPPTGAWDLVLRDALAARALEDAALEADLLDTLRARSPLTSVLDRPPAGAEDEAIVTLDELAAHPDGRRALVRAFSRPGAAPAVRRFRAFVMERLRLRERGPAGMDFVLEVYEAALVFHGEEMRAEIASAHAVVSRDEPDREGIDRALAVASFWGPLANVRRASPEVLRARVCLELDVVIEACRLHRAASRMVGEDA